MSSRVTFEATFEATFDFCFDVPRMGDARGDVPCFFGFFVRLDFSPFFNTFGSESFYE